MTRPILILVAAMALFAEIARSPAELIRATSTPGLFAKTVSDGRWKLYPHLAKLDRAIVDTINGEGGIRRLMVTMPPQHGKSQLCSEYLPAWFCGTFPDRRVILASYNSDYAREWGGKAQALFEEFAPSCFGLSLNPRVASSNRWEIAGHRGGMRTAGMDAGITGKPAELFIIDDPHKNSAEVGSLKMRNTVWDNYRSAVYTRLQNSGAVILIQTRWHEDDLGGRILKQRGEGGDEWRIVNMPAIDAVGKALCPDRFPLKRLQQIRRVLGEYFWSAMYQQNPTPREGLMFKVERLEFVDANEVPRLVRVCRAWDMAATANDGDFTAGVKIGIDGRGIVYVMDVARGQWSTDERDMHIRLTAGIDGKAVKIRGPQDPGAAGVSAALAFQRGLKGHSVKTLPVSGDKETRADPYSSQVNRGDVRIVRGSWNEAYVEELRTFPLGTHDDQVDASSDAYDEVASHRSLLVS